MLPPPIPLRRQPTIVASPCIPTYCLYGSVHYELCRLAWNRRVLRGRASLPRVHASACSNVPLGNFSHKITHCSTYTTFGSVPTLLFAECPFVPLEAWLSVEMDEPSILLKRIAFNAIHSRRRQCSVSIKSSVHCCLLLVP